MKLTRLVALVALTAVLGAGCATDGSSDGSSDATTTSSVTPSTTAPPVSTTSPPAAPSTTTTGPPATTTSLVAAGGPEGSGCSPGPGDLPDGTWFGFPVEVTETGMEFDLACWFTGEAAIAAADEDGEEFPPNDYYVRNEVDTTRTVAAPDDVTVLWYASGDPNSDVSTDWAGWLRAIDIRGFTLGVWLEIDNGALVEVTEQWVP